MVNKKLEQVEIFIIVEYPLRSHSHEAAVPGRKLFEWNVHFSNEMRVVRYNTRDIAVLFREGYNWMN